MSLESDSYLQSLHHELTVGTRDIAQADRQRHEIFIRSSQRLDGGFAGREGPSDLYYASFALRSLTLLDSLDEVSSAGLSRFFRSKAGASHSLPDLFSLLYGATVLQARSGEDVLEGLQAGHFAAWENQLLGLATPDGGYARAAGQRHGSTYQTFLTGLTFEMLGKRFPDSAQIRQFVQSRQREDGGFVEIPPMKRSGANPTAAGVGILEMLGEPLPGDVRAAVSGLLRSLVAVEGGLRANSRIPFADLLSTFTGLWTLHRCGSLDPDLRASCLRFITACALPEGGFRAGLWDDRPDLEYTFYGIGTLALLHRYPSP